MGKVFNFFKRSRDIPDPPDDLSLLKSIGIWGDSTSFSLVEKAYKTLLEALIGPDIAMQDYPYVEHLNKTAAQCKTVPYQWQELLALGFCEFWVVIPGQISFEQASEIPKILVSFCFDKKLGMVIDKQNQMTFFRVGALRQGGIGGHLGTLEEGLDIKYIKAKMKREGLKVETL